MALWRWCWRTPARRHRGHLHRVFVVARRKRRNGPGERKNSRADVMIWGGQWGLALWRRFGRWPIVLAWWQVATLFFASFADFLCSQIPKVKIFSSKRLHSKQEKLLQPIYFLWPKEFSQNLTRERNSQLIQKFVAHNKREIEIYNSRKKWYLRKKKSNI